MPDCLVVYLYDDNTDVKQKNGDFLAIVYQHNNIRPSKRQKKNTIKESFEIVADNQAVQQPMYIYFYQQCLLTWDHI